MECLRDKEFHKKMNQPLRDSWSLHKIVKIFTSLRWILRVPGHFYELALDFTRCSECLQVAGFSQDAWEC